MGLTRARSFGPLRAFASAASSFLRCPNVGSPRSCGVARHAFNGNHYLHAEFTEPEDDDFPVGTGGGEFCVGSI